MAAGDAGNTQKSSPNYTVALDRLAGILTASRLITAEASGIETTQPTVVGGKGFLIQPD